MNLKTTLFIGALCIASAAHSFVILDDEHVDIGIGYGADWDLHVHDETNDIEYEPDEALFYLGTGARETRPAGSSFDFIGPANQTIWRIRETPRSNVPFLGISTEETGDIFESYTETDPRLLALAGTLTGDWVRLQLKSVSGPGEFSVWSSSDNGPIEWMSSFNGIGSSDYLFVRDGAHQHFNFALTATGVHAVTFEASGLIGGQRQFSGDVTYYFGAEAVPEPATLGALALGLAALARRKRRA